MDISDILNSSACVQQFPRVTSIGSLPPETLGKSRGPPQNPAETPQNPRRDPAEPSERPPQSPRRGKFPRRASRRVVPLGWWPSGMGGERGEHEGILGVRGYISFFLGGGGRDSHQVLLQLIMKIAAILLGPKMITCRKNCFEQLIFELHHTTVHLLSFARINFRL